jgi:hypothetical protein
MVWCGNHLHPRHCSGASVLCIYRLKSACVLAFMEAILGPCEWVKSGGKGVWCSVVGCEWNTHLRDGLDGRASARCAWEAWMV